MKILYLKHSMVLNLEAILLQFYNEYLILDYERDQKILYKLNTGLIIAQVLFITAQIG